VAAFPDLTPTLAGRLVRLEPLTPAHADGLLEAGDDPRIWRWMPYPVTATREVLSAWIEDARSTRAPFAILDLRDGRPIGSSSFMGLRPEHRGLEIGWTWLTPSVWGRGANVEAKLLLLEHAFERLGCIRVEFKTDARNERSRAALAALPAQFEGIFRRHMVIRDGELRDSAWYSIIDDEWPQVKAALTARLEGGT
jgi:N-acetyltransferase